MITPEHLAPDLSASLEAAATRCRTALADYRAGVLDEAELRDSLLEAGLVPQEDGVWILDLQAGCWLRYDGLAVDALRSSRVDAGLARLRDVIDELADATTGVEASS